MTRELGTALVTGASSGIGAAYADRLADRGHDLVLVARNRPKLDALAQRISSRTGRSVEVLVADLTRRDDLHRVEEVLRSNPAITMLVNNAGVGALSPLLNSDVDAMQAMIELNVTALTRLTYAFAPAAVGRGGGTLINLGSIVAVIPELFNGVYGATKAYVLALSQSLRHELADRGMRVQVVLPGATATDFWEIAGQPVENILPQEFVMPVGDLVDAALTGLDAGEFVTIPALPDPAMWEAYQHARLALKGNMSRAEPAQRYRSAA